MSYQNESLKQAVIDHILPYISGAVGAILHILWAYVRTTLWEAALALTV